MIYESQKTIHAPPSAAPPGSACLCYSLSNDSAYTPITGLHHRFFGNCSAKIVNFTWRGFTPSGGLLSVTVNSSSATG